MSSTDYVFSEDFSSAVRAGDMEKAYSAVAGCDGSDAANLYLRGLMRSAGAGTKQDREAGLADLDAAASAGFDPAGIVADEVREWKPGIEKFLSLRIRAEAKDLDACREIFPLYDTGKYDDGSRTPVRKDHAEAVRLYMPCADAGDHVAQETIGYMFLMGKGVEKDSALAIRLLTAAADGGLSRAAYRIAYMYDTGQCYVDQDLEKAVSWYKRAAEMGNADAAYQLSGILFMKDTKWFDMKTGQKYLQQAADGGCPDGEHQMGLMYAYGANGFKRDPEKATKYLVAAAEHGVQQAQVDYANMCFEGQLLPRNMDEAAKWFKVAAEGFNGTAMYALGCMYANGYSFAEDDKKAAEWFTSAAEGGEPNAQYALACFYYEGRGVEKDEKKAAAWFQESAEQGHPGAMSFLGMFKITGRVVDQDIEGGLELLKKAANGGYYEAQYYLGKLYVEGEYVKKDIGYAKKMLSLAAKQGDPDAAALLDEIKKKRIR